MYLQWLTACEITARQPWPRKGLGTEENRRRSFHSVFHRCARSGNDPSSPFQVPQNKGLTGLSRCLLYCNPWEDRVASNCARPAKQSHWEEEKRADQTQNSVNSNAENPQWQRDQPNERIND